MEQELPYERKNSPDAVVSPYRGSIFLTTVYPTSTHGAHGNSGGKSAGKDVFLSGKGRKRPEISGKRYSGIVWDQDAAGSSPVASTRKKHFFGSAFFNEIRLTASEILLRNVK